MEIASQHGYLLISNPIDNTSSPTLEYQSNLAETILTWNAASRVSPIWSFGAEKEINQDLKLDLKSHICFLGPLSPYHLSNTSDFLENPDIRVFLSLGMHNLILQLTLEDDVNLLIGYAKQQNVPLEVWQVVDNHILSQKIYAKKPSEKEWKSIVRNISNLKKEPELQLAINEFVCLSSSTISRATYYSNKYCEEIISVTQHIYEILESNELGTIDPITLSFVTSINAGLSRFSSQALSGTHPINNTECHYWIHSFLGIGVANLAISNLVSFIADRIGKQLIPNRIEKLRENTKDIKLLSSIEANNDFWEKDHLAMISLDKNEIDELEPEISFFSGRDGFRSQLYNISIPLTCISSCVASRWTLLTITHEISHKLVRGVLSIILPMPNGLEGELTRNRAIELFQDKSLSSNWLDNIRSWLLETISTLESAEEGEEKSQTSSEDIYSVAQTWYSEVEEIIVHVFDFLYFYKEEPKRYVESIWLTWSVIPNISSRIPEYVMRTVCAVLATNIRRGAKAESVSIERVKNILRELKYKNENVEYISEAIEYIETNTELIKKKIVSRKPLVKFARAFLYSRTIVGVLWKERGLRGKSVGKEGYTQKHLRLDEETFNNPLGFIEAFSVKKNPSEAEALWLFHQLAFSYQESK